MPKNNEIKFSQCFSLPNPSLRSYFGRVREGQPDEYRTTFAKGEPVSKVLEDWLPQLDRLKSRWPTLFDFEMDLASKVGPLSIMKPLSERMEDIEAYYSGVSLPQKPVANRAINAVLSEFTPIRGLHIRSERMTVELMRKSTNSGSPYFAKRRDVVRDTVPCEVYAETMEQYLNVHHSPGARFNIAAVLGWRGQEGGDSIDDVKQRVVWMFPFAVNIQELRVYQPFKEAAQRFNLVPAWVSFDEVDKRITRMFDTKGKDDLVVCTDFSKFDQHFNPTLQHVAKTILAALFKGDPKMEGWLECVFPIKYEIPLAYDYGYVKTGPHGMGSGSGGTNDDETLAHRTLQYEAAITSGQQLNEFSQCLGDDGVLTYPGITVDHVVESYSQHGLEMNSDKQYASKEDCVYLRRWHHTNYRIDGVCAGVYSTCRALGRLCEQERYYNPDVWSREMVALRQLSILENVKYHPLRDLFLEFCMKRDKYRLGIDIPGFMDNIETYASEANDLMPDFLGYTRMEMESEGISKWWVVQALKSR